MLCLYSKYKDKTYDIIDEIMVESPSPKLVVLLNALTTIEDGCQAFLAKLQLF